METLVDSHAAIARALEALARWSRTRPTRPGLLVRRALGSPSPDDDSLAHRLAAQFRVETRMDGSVRGEFLTTAWRAIELMDVDHAADEAGTVRVVGFLLSRQDQAGAYGNGIGRPEHAGRDLPGFFSAAAVEERIAPVTLPTGAVVADEADARFAVSCLALRAVLKARKEGRPQVQRHAESLAELARRWGGPTPLFLTCSMLHGLALAPHPMRDVIPALVGEVAKGVTDGAWPGVDLFHVLQALLAVPDAEATTLIRNALPALLKGQDPDGGFEGAGGIGEERGWIATRALLRARGDLG